MKLDAETVKSEETLFNNWKIVNNSIYYQEESVKQANIDVNSNYLSIYDLIKYDKNGNLILFFIINELNKLIGDNDNKFTKVNVVNMIIDLINYSYQLYNREAQNAMFDIKRFKYILDSGKYILDIEKKGHGLENEKTGIYEEYTTPEDVGDNEIEEMENDAEMYDIDMDVEADKSLEADEEFITDFNQYESHD